MQTDVGYPAWRPGAWVERLAVPHTAAIHAAVAAGAAEEEVYNAVAAAEPGMESNAAEERAVAAEVAPVDVER